MDAVSVLCLVPVGVREVFRDLCREIALCAGGSRVGVPGSLSEVMG